MPDNDAPGFVTLAREWVKNKALRLQAQNRALQGVQSHVETVDKPTRDRWESIRAKRKHLEKLRNIRMSGGLVATLLEVRSLMVFGVGGEYQADSDDAAEWLNENLGNMDTLLHDLGLDAYTYGYALTETVETNGGDLAGLTFIEPWTTVPLLNETGHVKAWDHRVAHGNGTHSDTFTPDEVHHFKVMKSSGRDPVGQSLLARGLREAENYRDNQAAIQNAVQLYGFPTYHVRVGPEDGPVIDDNELRRIRPQFEDISELTRWITGRDVEIEKIQGELAEFEALTEHDLAKLAIVFMLPVELTQLGGGEGLGSGFPAKVRERMFLLSAQAHQNLLAQQLEDLGGELLEEYAPGLDASGLAFEFEDPITDLEELKTKVDAVGGDMTVNERRAAFDLPRLDDDGVGEQYLSPATEERLEQDTSPPVDGGEGLFSMQQPGERDGLASDVLPILSEYATMHGAIDDPIHVFEAWVTETADAPTRARDRVDTAISLYAAAQGVSVEGVREQPVSNLVAWLERHRDLAHGDSGDAGIWWEPVIQELYDRIWSDGEKALFGFSEFETPGFVKARLFEEVMEGGPIFSDLETIPSDRLMELRSFMAEELASDGWTITDLRDEIQDRFDVEEHHAETIARSTTQNMVNNAAEERYRERDDFDELRFTWSGPSDHRTSDVCEEIKSRLSEGGVHLDELKDLVHTVAEDQGLDPRDWTPHPQCRHRFVRVV